jgi:uncharacterized protein HemY
MPELLEAEFLMAKGEFESARQKYAALVEGHSEELQVLQSASQVYFQHG